MKDLHAYGNELATAWVLLHDTGADGTRAFDANTLAKAAGATPLKRPENGQFRPGSGFTRVRLRRDRRHQCRHRGRRASYGGFGAVLKLSQAGPAAATGTLSLVYRWDPAHTGLDNVDFWSASELLFVEDAGDTLHGQRNALDSGY